MKPLTCQQAHDAIDEDALGLLGDSGKGALDAHVAVCAPCREALTATRDAITSFKDACHCSADEDRVIAGIRWRVQCALAENRPASGRSWRRQILRSAAAVALLALGAAVLFSSVRGVRETDNACACHSWQLTDVQAGDASGVARPLISGSRVIALRQVGHEKWLTAVDRHTGKRIWQVSAPFEGGAATDGARVFIWAKTQDGERLLQAYAIATGKRVWERVCPDPSRVAKPRELVAGEQGVGWVDRHAVTWLQARTGSEQWSFALTPGETLRPKLIQAPGSLVVVDAQQACALALKDGALLWSRPLESGLAGWLEPRAGVDNDRLIVARTVAPKTDRLTCLDLRTGATLWTRETADTTQHLLLQTEILYARGYRLQAFDSRTGEPVWALPLNGCSPVTLADGRLYLMAGFQGLLAVDPTTGTLLWHADGLASCAGVAVMGRMGYVRTRDGVLHAIPLGEALRGDAPGHAEKNSVRSTIRRPA